ncbi:copper chaperone [Candidatus Woesearchaeota archaeon]|nr:MAG: copper chaperone [Candidatus Woesearchaeota archaeon]
MPKNVLRVKGMHCKSCVMLVTDALTEIGTTNVSIALDGKKQEAIVSFEGNPAKAVAAIKELGYRV